MLYYCNILCFNYFYSKREFHAFFCSLAYQIWVSLNFEFKMCLITILSKICFIWVADGLSNSGNKKLIQ